MCVECASGSPINPVGTPIKHDLSEAAGNGRNTKIAITRAMNYTGTAVFTRDGVKAREIKISIRLNNH